MKKCLTILTTWCIMFKVTSKEEKDWFLKYAGVMELADVLDSKSSGSDTVPVRPRSPAP